MKGTIFAVVVFVAFVSSYPVHNRTNWETKNEGEEYLKIEVAFNENFRIDSSPNPNAFNESISLPSRHIENSFGFAPGFVLRVGKIILNQVALQNITSVDDQTPNDASDEHKSSRVTVDGTASLNEKHAYTHEYSSETEALKGRIESINNEKQGSDKDTSSFLKEFPKETVESTSSESTSSESTSSESTSPESRSPESTSSESTSSESTSSESTSSESTSSESTSSESTSPESTDSESTESESDSETEVTEVDLTVGITAFTSENNNSAPIWKQES